MYILTNSNQYIQLFLDIAEATTPMDIVVSYANVTPTSFTPAANDTVSNGTSSVQIVNGPGSGQNLVKEISVVNNDTIPHVTTIQYFDGSSTYVDIANYLLFPGDQLYYTDNSGWVQLDSLGADKSNGQLIQPSQFLWNPIIVSGNTPATNIFLTTGVLSAFYVGAACKVSSSVNVAFKITTGSSAPTYAEVAIYTGSVGAGFGSTTNNLTLLGYADISADVTTPGVYNVNISLSTPLQIGQSIWIAFGVSAATMPTFACGAVTSYFLYNNFEGTATGQPSATPSPTITLVQTAIPLLWGYVN